jgi:NADH-quinone oxidoreductase subunit F
MSKITSAKALDTVRKSLQARQSATTGKCITVCSGTGCLAYHAEDLAAAFEHAIEKNGLDKKVTVKRTGCHGFCERGPVVVIAPQNICYLKVKAEDVNDIIDASITKDGVIERLLYKDSATGASISCVDEIPFYKYQKRLLLDHNTRIDPTKIDDYIADGGYAALCKALFEMKPEEVIGEVSDSGLRGRGGAGFSTGWKWESTRKATGETKYVIVNADEGDPGAYMDRSLLEGNPHSIIEGLIIAGYAIGAREGFIYVRQEYPLALANTLSALEQARDYGLLGTNILGSGCDFDITVHRGAGAFVSGESSALMNAIEGHVGEPRPKYVHTSDKGLWDKPSCLNNVETFANVPLIIAKGAKQFASLGTPKSSGTKIFSLVGHVVNSGLVEVPMGMSLRDIIFKIGGGIPNGKKFKAVQTGGPSGGVLPEELLDMPVDFDELAKVGSMMGSGGMIVMNEDTCMVDTARYYVDFLANESCGKCTPCREGLRQMLRIINDICSGKGNTGDIELLEELSQTMMTASLCALGQSAPNPVLSSIKYFRKEYEAHVNDKRCPALACKDLIEYTIDAKKCKSCGLCAKQCPSSAIDGGTKKPYVISQGRCIKCGACLSACPPKTGAVIKTPSVPALVPECA